MTELRYKTGFKRCIAAIVDAIVFMPLLLVNQWLLNNNSTYNTLLAWTVFTTFLPLFYSILLHYKFGQTVGRWVVRVKVLDINEERKLSFMQSVLRDSVYLGVMTFGFLYYLILFPDNIDAAFTFTNYGEFSDNILFWWTIIELVTILSNKKRRAVHDFIARSVVVRE